MEQGAKGTRLRELVEVGIVLSSELALDAVLRLLTDASMGLTGAKYAAVGVLDDTGTRFTEFVTSGVDAETYAQIGDLPSGRGVLGVLIDDPRPLRLANLADDARSVGFPPSHPSMTSFLGVPIVIRGAVFGSLYLTEKADGAEFTDADEEVATLLAAQAGVAVENARLYEALRRWNEHLEALAEIGDAITRQISLEELLPLACVRARSLLDSDMALVSMPDANNVLGTVAAAGEGTDQLAEARALSAETARRSKSAEVFKRGRVERVDSMLDDPEVDQAVARSAQLRTGLYVPLIVGDRTLGVLAVLNKGGPAGRFNDDDVRLAESFAARLSAAIESAERIERESLGRVARAQEQERSRLARELHDETGQAVASIILGIGDVEAASNPDETRKACEALRERAQSALSDIRRIAFELRPRVLDDHGLGAAIDGLAEYLKDRAGLDIDVEVNLDERLTPELESAVYRVVQEALTNVVKHAVPRAVSVLVARRGDDVLALVEDDGAGFDLEAVSDERMGLSAMYERVEILGGSLAVESEPGRGTVVQARLPLSRS